MSMCLYPLLKNFFTSLVDCCWNSLTVEQICVSFRVWLNGLFKSWLSKTKIVKWIFSNNFFWNSFVYRFIRIFDISVERLFSIVTWKLLSGTCSMVFILLRKWFLSLIYEKISLIIGCRWKSRHSEIFEGWLMIALITGFLGIFLSWTLEMFSIFKCVSNFLFFSLIF